MKRERWIIAHDALGEIAREVWQPETPQEQSEALRKSLYPNPRPKGWGLADELAEMRDLIDRGLIGMGWPPSNVPLAVTPEGGWRVVEGAHDVGEGEAFRWSFTWIDQAAEPLTEAYWLGRMAFSLAAIDAHLERGDMLTLFQHAMRLGAHQTEIDVRKIALRYAESGKKLTGRNKGTQKKTQARIDFLHRVMRETGHQKRQEIARAAWDDPERKKHFDDFDKLYRFLGRNEF